MERGYICPIVEVENPLTGGLAYTVDLPPLQTGDSAQRRIPTQEGVPLYTHALVVIKTDDFSAMDGFEGAEPLDEVPASLDDAAIAALMAGRERG